MTTASILARVRRFFTTPKLYPYMYMWISRFRLRAYVR
jgi:hypothetical protein